MSRGLSPYRHRERSWGMYARPASKVDITVHYAIAHLGVSQRVLPQIAEDSESVESDLCERFPWLGRGMTSSRSTRPRS